MRPQQVVRCRSICDETYVALNAGTLIDGWPDLAALRQGGGQAIFALGYGILSPRFTRH